MASPYATDPLPIFPLSNVVLLPEVSVPLFIFEPRYRAMTEAALDGDRRIGMVTVHPDHTGEMDGDPPVFEIGCEGRITHAVRNPDGTFRIVLAGEHRFRILAEPPRPASRLYRTAHIERLADPAPEDAAGRQRLAQLREELLASLVQLASRNGRTQETRELEPEAFAEIPTPKLVNALAQSIDFVPLERQQLLEADGVLVRCENLVDLLRFRLVDPRGAGSGSIPTVH